jgi:GrpB-like predicted nucleotidyltransferase (UPF0157 family)/transposase
VQGEVIAVASGEGRQEEGAIGLKKSTVRVVAHRGEWRELFQREWCALRDTVGPLVLDIQHIGSTAVPGLDAKPIIDIAVAVPSRQVILQPGDPLRGLGYLYRGDAGGDGGHLFVRESSPEARTHHLHVVEVNDPQWRQWLLFRDMLRVPFSANFGFRGFSERDRRRLRADALPQDGALRGGRHGEPLLRGGGQAPGPAPVDPLDDRGVQGRAPPLNPNEISNIVWVRTGRKPDRKTVKRVLSEEPIPLRMVRRFEPYHDIPEARERRLAVVRLHAEGWTVKAIAGYLGVNRDTVYRTLKRWIEEDVEGLEDKPRGRPPGVRKVDLGTIERVRRLQENPGLGAFRVRAALKQAGIHLSTATCGRILARNRAIYGLGKPAGGGRPKKPMPFASNKRHEYWSVDVRYLDMVDKDLVGGMAYAITVIENHSRMILASAVSPTQDLSAYLSVLYAAVESYGSPGALVTDSGSVFLANRAMAVYEALRITKHEIQRGRPWQNYAETTLTVPMECPSMYYRLRRAASGVRRSARGRQRRDSGRSSDAARWRACRCV